MAGLAEGLPVGPIPEERHVAAVRGDVVHHRRRVAAERAGGMQGEEGAAGFLPGAGIAAFPGARPVRVVAALAVAGGGDLAGAAGAMGHHAAAGAGVGRACHRPNRARSSA